MNIELCRVCAQGHSMENSLKLFTKPNQKTIHEIKQITGVMLKRDKEMPENMCVDCQTKLETALDFRTTCKRAQKLLRQAIKEKSKDISKDTETEEDDDVESEKEVSLEIKCSPRSDDSNTPFIHYSDTKIIEATTASRLSDSDDKKVLIFELESEIDTLAIQQQFENDEDEKPLAFRLVKETEKLTDPTIAEEIDGNRLSSEKNTHAEESSTSAASQYSIGEDPDWKLADDENSEEINLQEVKTKRKKYTRKTNNSDEGLKRQKRTNTSDHNEKKERKSKSVPTSEKETKYMCYLCGAPFYCLTYYTHHMNRHKGEKTFACDQCPQRFYTKQMLKRHSYHHTGVRPYACSYCPQTFVDHSARTRHERAHNNVRPYKCTECGKGFNTNYVLKNHILTHTGIREFNCALCQRSFVQKKHLETHYRSMFHKQNAEKANNAEIQ